LKFEVCIFEKEKIIVIYKANSELRLHAMILNGKEVKPDRRFRVSKRRLSKLIARLIDTGYDIHPFLDNLKAE